MCVVNLHPLLSLQVQCYPECTAELRPHYKSTTTERRTQSRQWDCSTALLFTLWPNHMLTVILT